MTSFFKWISNVLVLIVQFIREISADNNDYFFRKVFIAALQKS